MNQPPTGSDEGDDRGPDLVAILPHLARLSGALNRGKLIERAMDQVGITLDRPAMSVLAVLHTADEPLRIGEIARRMQVVGPHVTRQLHELERRGLVHRVADPDDQRARLVELTPAGAAAADRYLRTIVGWFAEVVADWPAEDRRTFGRLLSRFVDDLSTRLAALDEDA